eukprot:scaffold222333_cov30-Tisochrysis_lutea.AAC.3
MAVPAVPESRGGLDINLDSPCEATCTMQKVPTWIYNTKRSCGGATHTSPRCPRIFPMGRANILPSTLAHLSIPVLN